MTAPNKFTITFGGWYQRTTLHLTEVYAFLAHGYSKLELPKEKLDNFRKNLNLKEVTREVGYLEYVKAKTNDGIEIRYYEDGLYILETSSENIKQAKDVLEDYFKTKFSPAISYIFSLGAPTPKVLANIETVHPIVVGVISQDTNNFQIDTAQYGQVYSKITSLDITVCKTNDYIFILTRASQKNTLTCLTEMQIFFREFKDQLEQYLNIHRKVWEEISRIKEAHSIKGKDVENIRTRLDRYQKTINLISSRINQMNTYVRTRASISKDLQIEEYLKALFQYKFEVLGDTHAYIKELWKMTTDYLTTAIEILKEIENRRINNSIKSLELITSVGVVAGIINYLSRTTLPTITTEGLVYFLVLMISILPINILITTIAKNMKYKLNFPDRNARI